MNSVTSGVSQSSNTPVTSGGSQSSNAMTHIDQIKTRAALLHASIQKTIEKGNSVLGSPNVIKIRHNMGKYNLSIIEQQIVAAVEMCDKQLPDLLSGLFYIWHEVAGMGAPEKDLEKIKAIEKVAKALFDTIDRETNPKHLRRWSQ